MNIARIATSLTVLVGVLAGSTACYSEAAAPEAPDNGRAYVDRANDGVDKVDGLMKKADALAGRADRFLKDLDVEVPNMPAPNTTGADYDRDAFGAAWYDVDDNGCDTRSDILARDLTDLVIDGDDCTVLAGTLNDPYTGDLIEYERGHSLVDVDHVVALGAAWSMGADEWNDDTRLAFANDPANLEASYMGANRSKGDDTLSEWMPENVEFQCTYATAFMDVATKYDLRVAPADAQVAAEVC